MRGAQHPGELPTIGFLGGEHAGVHLPIRAVGPEGVPCWACRVCGWLVRLRPRMLSQHALLAGVLSLRLVVRLR